MTDQPTIAQQEPRPGLFSRIINVFFTPSKTFASLIQKPDWITPLIVTSF